MSKLKPNDVRKLSHQKTENLLKEKQNELMYNKARNQQGETKNIVRKLRKEIALIKTIKRERELYDR